MDFLKSCTTNLYAVEGYSSIEYQIYTAPQPEQDGAAKEKEPESRCQTALPWGEERHAILVELRRRGALVQSAAVQKKICVFGGFQQAEEHMKELRWPLALTGRLDVSSLSRPGPDAKVNLTNQNIYGMFLSAVEESLSITLGRTCRAIRVGHMTWIIPTQSQDEPDGTGDAVPEHSLLTLRTQITAIGNLMLLPEVVSTGFKSVSDNAEDARTVILAPSGTTASIAEDLATLSVRDGESDAAKFRHQMRREARARLARKAREEAWKSAVRSRLGHTTAVPVNLDDSTLWTRVRVSNPRPPLPDAAASSPWDRVKPAALGHSCLWPTKLCFEKSDETRPHIASPQVSDMEWLKSGEYKDPLATAEQWFLGKDKRDEQALADQRKAEAEAEKEAVVPQPLDTLPDQPALSSPVNIRTQDQSSVHGIYPTPPDGILPTAFADVMASANTGEDNGPPTTTNTEDYALTRQPSNTSQIMADKERPRKNSTDELFDDMDEEMFGAPDVDVTDADFSFFDDTDGAANSRKRFSNRIEEGVVESSATQESSHSKDGDEETMTDGPLTGPLTASNTNQDTGATTVDTSSPSHGDKDSSADARDDTELEKAHSIPAPEITCDEPTPRPPERFQTPPLSPLQIKQKFLPSPAPTSGGAQQEQDSPHEAARQRRSSNFNPIVFKGDIGSFDAKYRDPGRFGDISNSMARESAKQNAPPVSKSNRSHSIIDLPPKKLVSRSKRSGSLRQHLTQAAIPKSRDDTSSCESDTDSSSSGAESEQDVAPPSVIGKRKRLWGDNGGPMQSPRTYTDIESDAESAMSEDKGNVDCGAILDLLLSRDGQKDPQRGLQESQHKFGERPSVWKTLGKQTPPAEACERDIWGIFGFNQQDLIGIAQIVAQQSINTESNTETGDAREQPQSTDTLLPEDNIRLLAATYNVAQSAVKQVFSASVDCDFSKLASIISVHAEHTPLLKGQARPPPAPRRPNGGPAGAQHLFAIQPPSVHLQRAGAAWEMLPSSLKFWEPLGLEPACGPKHVTAYAIYPDSGDLGNAVADFLDNIGQAYENCKLGSHTRGSTYTDYADGLVGFPLPEDRTARSIFKSMRNACVAFGDVLRDEASLEPDKALVVYMFSSPNDEAFTKYLCGCFWALQQAFTYGADSDDVLLDFVLQVVPLNRVANPDALAVPEPTWLSSLANQIYDRIPLREPLDSKSPWVIPSAPCVQLISPLPRRINFALHERPPKSLLEEAQILHVAYAISSDNNWLTAAWSDITGRYQFNTSFCTRDLDGKAVLSEVRDMTLSLANAATTWRIFVARVGTMRNWEKEVWKEQTSENWSILLLDIDIAPTLQIQVTENTANFPAIPQPGAGIMTPASTPQSANFTVSPEAHGAAPSTPGEAPESANPPDPDSYLIDTTDETWGLVLPFSAVHGPYELKRTLSSGVLLKRGNADTKSLPSLAVDIIDILMPKIPEGQPNWLAPRSPDAVLREVLSWYRGLGLLARVRGLDATGAVPWHVRVACSAAEALTGFED